MKIWENLKKNSDMRQSELYVIAGLGNPGREYAATKHNVGFSVVEGLGESYNIAITKFKHRALMGDGNIKGKKVILLKPQTYMNLSGESIQEVLRFYKVPISHFCVVYDDTSLSVGTVRIREKGSAGGHNGMKSIISHLGTDEFVRIKVGIGEKPNGWDLADYVLAPFGKDDLPLMVSGIEKAQEAVELTLSFGAAEASNRINRKDKPKKAAPKLEDLGASGSENE